MKQQLILSAFALTALSMTLWSCGSTSDVQKANNGKKSYHLQVQGANTRQVQAQQGGTRTIHVSSPTGGLYIPSNNGGGAASNGGTTPTNGGNTPANGGGTTTTTTTTTTPTYQSLPTNGSNRSSGSSSVGVKQTNTNKGSKK